MHDECVIVHVATKLAPKTSFFLSSFVYIRKRTKDKEMIQIEKKACVKYMCKPWLEVSSSVRTHYAHWSDSSRSYCLQGNTFFTLSLLA